MSEKMKVLAVDDDPDVLDILRSDIAELGYEILTAKHGKEALELIKETPVSIVVSDLNMPHMTGIQLLRALRQNRFQHPFIVLSGFGTRDEAVELLRLGAYNFLNKPVAFEELKTTLAEAAKYVHILDKAKDEVKLSLGVGDKEINGQLEEAVYALARMKAIRRR